MCVDCMLDSVVHQLFHCLAGLIEHAAWTKGDAYLDAHLKSMPWYQQILLDAVAVCTAIAAIVAVLSYWSFRWCSRHLRAHVKVV